MSLKKELGIDKHIAIERVKDLVSGYLSNSPVAVQLEWLVNGFSFKTEWAQMRVLNETRIENFRDELFDKYLSSSLVEQPEKTEQYVVHLKQLVAGQRVCPHCESVMRSDNLVRHLETCVTGPVCPICQKEVDGNMKTHIKVCNAKMYPCRLCDEAFFHWNMRAAHEKKCRRVQEGGGGAGKRRRLHPGDQTAVDGNFRIVTVSSNINSNDYEGELLADSSRMQEILEVRLETGLKYYISITLTLHKVINREETKFANFHSTTSILLQGTNIATSIQMHISAICRKIDEYIRNGSGWTIESIREINLWMTTYTPIAGSSYLALPGAIKMKQSIVNIQNVDDDQCLKWCLLAHLHPVEKDKHRVSKYRQYENELNFDGIEWPCSYTQISKVEQQNNLTINVFGFDEEEGFYNIYINDKQTLKEDPKSVINLLLIANEHTQHYCLITSLSGMLYKFRTKHTGKQHYCPRCMHAFPLEDTLLAHYQHCRKHKVQRIEMPEDDHIEFTSHRKTVRTPVWISADFESYIKPNPTEETSDEASWTSKLATHVPSCYSLKVVADDPDFDMPPEFYEGTDAARHFVLRLHEIYELVEPLLEGSADPEPLTPAQLKKLKNRKDCHICRKRFKKTDVRHLDHCHHTGRVLGYAHACCNMERIVDKHLRIGMHNLSGYDLHLAILDICALEDDVTKVHLIPKTLERYTSLKTEKFVFIDTLQHLSSGLDKLAKNLVDDSLENLALLRKYIDDEWDGDEERFMLLTTKGEYPYSYMTSPSVMDEGLPSIEHFHNDLTDEPCSPERYAHVQAIWRAFGCRSLKDLTKIYCICDVLLLAAVFNKYRAQCLSNFGLEALLYFTAPGD